MQLSDASINITFVSFGLFLLLPQRQTSQPRLKMERGIDVCGGMSSYKTRPFRRRNEESGELLSHRLFYNLSRRKRSRYERYALLRIRPTSAVQMKPAACCEVCVRVKVRKSGCISFLACVRWVAGCVFLFEARAQEKHEGIITRTDSC